MVNSESISAEASRSGGSQDYRSQMDNSPEVGGAPRSTQVQEDRNSEQKSPEQMNPPPEKSGE